MEFIVAAAIIDGANNLVDVLQPKNPPGDFIAAKAFMREVTALVTVPPAAAYIFHFTQTSKMPPFFYM